VTATVERNRRSTGTYPVCNLCSSVAAQRPAPIAVTSSAAACSSWRSAACAACGRSLGQAAYLSGLGILVLTDWNDQRCKSVAADDSPIVHNVLRGNFAKNGR
jgi:hypothetical protein